jgi:hypothetical protein
MTWSPERLKRTNPLPLVDLQRGERIPRASTLALPVVLDGIVEDRKRRLP